MIEVEEMNYCRRIKAENMRENYRNFDYFSFSFFFLERFSVNLQDI